MQVTDDLIKGVVQQVLAQMGGPATNGAVRKPSGRSGVYPTADAAVTAAEAAIVAKRFPPVPPLMMNAVGMTIGAAVLLGLSFGAGEAHPVPRELATWLGLGYLVLFGSIATFVTYLFVLRRWTASGTSYMFVLAPVVAVAFAALFQGERITAGLVAGGALVIAGVYVGALLHVGKRDAAEQRLEPSTPAPTQEERPELAGVPADCVRCP
jgi:uncharacterized membrane protein